MVDPASILVNPALLVHFCRSNCQKCRRRRIANHELASCNSGKSSSPWSWAITFALDNERQQWSDYPKIHAGWPQRCEKDILPWSQWAHRYQNTAWFGQSHRTWISGSNVCTGIRQFYFSWIFYPSHGSFSSFIYHLSTLCILLQVKNCTPAGFGKRLWFQLAKKLCTCYINKFCRGTLTNWLIFTGLTVNSW